MKVRQWMKHPVRTIKPQDTILHARDLMERERLNQLPVVVDGRVVGIVTDRDLRDAFPSAFEPPRRPGDRRRAAPDPAAVPVESVMTQNVLAVRPDDAILEAARLMRRERIGAVPVIEQGRLVGVLTRSDLLEALIEVEGGPRRRATP